MSYVIRVIGDKEAETSVFSLLLLLLWLVLVCIKLMLKKIFTVLYLWYNISVQK